MNLEIALVQQAFADLPAAVSAYSTCADLAESVAGRGCACLPPGLVSRRAMLVAGIKG
jgi:hypothetical protein